MSSLQVASQRLEVSARSIDLTSALINASTSSNSVINIAIELGQWLGRERLNNYELEDFMKKAKGLIIPNYRGQVFLDNVSQGGLKNPLMDLWLKQSGSLGRLMARDPWLCWLVSTVACLFQFHREKFVSDVICSFIMRANPPTNAMHEEDIMYHPSRKQLKFVVDKIISSVWFNVVNSRHETIPLPPELLAICRYGHYLGQGFEFGAIAHALRENRPRVIIRTRHLFRNLTLWLLVHFSGLLRVTVSGRIIFEEALGNTARELELRVDKFCEGDGPCYDEGSISYELLEDIAGSPVQFLRGSFTSESTHPPQPGTRRKLYDIWQSSAMDSRARNHTVQLSIKCTAQQIMRWLLSLSLIPQYGQHLGFLVSFDHKQKGHSWRISEILKRIPEMLNMKWGEVKLPISKNVFVSLDPGQDLLHNALEDEDTFDFEDNYSTLTDSEQGLQRMSVVLPYFPILQDMLDEVRPLCNCSNCRQPRQSGADATLQYGCLRVTAFTEVLELLGHGVADGFNCRDASSVTNSDPVINGMLRLLLELCTRKKVLWNTWFRVAACVLLGCPFKHRAISMEPSGRGNWTNEALEIVSTEPTYAAIQYGNLAAIAPWLNLSQNLQVAGCFHIIESEGKLGTIVQSREGLQEFRGIDDAFAIIQTEQTESTESYVQRYTKSPLLPDDIVRIENDTTPVETDYILIPAVENMYRLLMRVKSANHSRIVDPSQAMVALSRGPFMNTCRHEQSEYSSSLSLKTVTQLYTFEELLGRWWNEELPVAFPDEESGGPSMDSNSRAALTAGCLRITHVLDSYLKRNIALALTVGNDIDGTSVNELRVTAHDRSICASCVQDISKVNVEHSANWIIPESHCINFDINLKDRRSLSLIQSH